MLTPAQALRLREIADACSTGDGWAYPQKREEIAARVLWMLKLLERESTKATKEGFRYRLSDAGRAAGEE